MTQQLLMTKLVYQIWTSIPRNFDGYLTASVMLPRGDEVLKAQVVARKRDANGNPIGKANSNPILDTREYVVEFEDGTKEVYMANMIAENMYAQVDSEGRAFALMSEIVDHESDARAMKIADGTFVDKQGRQRPRITTQGWRLLVEWKDGTTTWVPLKDLKESFPIEVAEYAVANKISEQPAFKWWVDDTLRKRHRIIKKVKSAKYWKRTHKFGIRLPHSVEEALRFDEESGTDFWRKAIEKEMRNVLPAFEFRDDDKMPIGYECIRCHMVFDIKIGDLTRKARFCANGNETDPPKESTFSTVVSRDTVRLFFLMAALHDTDILSADIQNAYLNAPVKEKLYTIAGKEFGPKNEGRPVIIVRALYGLRSSGKSFRDFLANNLREMGYASTKADPDLWMKPDCKTDGTEYYHYVICYVDDVAVTMEEPERFMDELGRRFTLKEGSVQEPTLYLGADVLKWYIAESDEPGKVRWALASTKYTKRAIADLETELDSIGKRLPTKVVTPLSGAYRPELDQTTELNAERQNYYQGLIGVLRWICELGRLDILMPVSMMSRYIVAARSGHLDQLFHIFAYLKRYDSSTMVFDDTEPAFDERRFKDCDWSEYYPGAKEALPPDMPAPRGRSVVMSCFVDADHAGCRVTRRSHRCDHFREPCPYSVVFKRQNTVESSTFGSEFVAMRIAIEMIEGLRYKLRMMGVGIEGPCNVFCDNNAVVLNSVNPSLC
ncbi:Reverse transcriptase (RNA-dependent DNA polymerase) [Fragilaria crotonensis]|nr:Reverse transcriptase (RNA-dependent DNA polymerase) [Fragilaria crotonensis]